MSKREVILAERAYFVHTLRGLKAAEWQAMTLCDGWTAEDLAAHLLVRERGGLLARTGIILPFLHQKHDAAIVKMKQIGHAEMLKRLAKPPAWIPMVGFNVIEFFVHNEDLLRGDLKRTRKLDESLEAALSGFVPLLSRLAWRRVEGAFNLVMHDAFRDEVHEQTIGRPRGNDIPELRLTGRPGEFILLFMGRARSAQLQIEGDVAARRIYDAADIGV